MKGIRKILTLIVCVWVILICVIVFVVWVGSSDAQEPNTLPYYPPPPAHPACLGRPWILKWDVDQSRYCDELGTYVLWACYDEQGQHLYYCSECFYLVDLPIVHNQPLGPLPTPAPTFDVYATPTPTITPAPTMEPGQ